MSAPPSQRLVTDLLLAVLRATPVPIGDGSSPVLSDDAKRWAVLLWVDGDPQGSWPAPEHALAMTYRLRSVGRDVSVAGGRQDGARMDAEGTADLLRPILLNRRVRLQGDGFRIIGRSWTPGGSIPDGRHVNVVDDFRFLVCRR